MAGMIRFISVQHCSTMTWFAAVTARLRCRYRYRALRLFSWRPDAFPPLHQFIHSTDGARTGFVTAVILHFAHASFMHDS